MSPEGFHLGVKRLGGSVGAPVVEKVQDSIRVREHGSCHGIERVKAGLVDLIVPQGEFKPGTRHGLARGIDSSQPLHQGEGLLHVGIQLEKHGSPLSLVHAPRGRVFKKQQPGTEQNLFPGFPVTEFSRPVLFPFQTGFFHLVGFLVDRLPAVLDP